MASGWSCYSGHAGAVGRDGGDRVHDFAVCGGERPAGSCRPEDESGLISVVTVAAYQLPVLVGAVLWGEPWRAPARWAVAIGVYLLAAWWGSSRNSGCQAGRGPEPGAAIIRAVLAAQLAMLVAGAAVLVTGLWMHLERVEALHEALHPGVAGAIALLLLQLAFAPNALIWSASYALGSGFSLGAGSVVAPAATQLGMVPGIPLLGALPSPGPGISPSSGGLLLARSLEQSRAGWCSVPGLLSGLIRPVWRAGPAACWLVWCSPVWRGRPAVTWGPPARGYGAAPVPLLVMAGTTMGLAGLITGLAFGLVSSLGPKLTRLCVVPDPPRSAWAGQPGSSC